LSLISYDIWHKQPPSTHAHDSLKNANEEPFDANALFNHHFWTVKEQILACKEQKIFSKEQKKILQ
jgi:hypothetical protein